jgi:hypothetical protein
MLFFDSLDSASKKCLFVDLAPSLNELCLSREASELSVE